jgi:hypothetical protein
MPFPATITLTVNAIAKVLQRVNQDSYGSEYQLNAATESLNLKIRHSKDSPDGDGLVMVRHNVFVEHVIFPTPTTAMKKFTATATIRQDRYSGVNESVDLGKALNVWLAAATNFADLGAGVN